MNELERSLAYKPSREELATVKKIPPRKLPKIAVVIPSFNQAQFLPETLDSVFSQGYPRLEVFVDDGGSSDESVEILQHYKKKNPKILRYVSEPDGGQFQGVNKGIDATDGTIIAWINSDDLYLPQTFWKIVTFFHFNRCALVVYGRNNYTDAKLNTIFEYPVDWSPVISEQRRRMMHCCLPPQPSLFFRREAVTLSGKLASPILDYELWLRWQRDIQFHFIDEHLSISRLHEDAKTIHDRTELIDGICEVVHEYYNTVPFSWVLQKAYNDAYGPSWMEGKSPPVTRAIRMKAIASWAVLNLRLAPRSVGRGFNNLMRFANGSLNGRV